MKRRRRTTGKLAGLVIASALVLLSLRAVAVGRNLKHEIRPVSIGAVDWTGEYRNAADVKGKGSWAKRFLKAVVGINDREKAMLAPYGVCVDRLGRLLVADTKGRVVHIFDPVRKKYKRLNRPPTDPFLSPIGVATDAEDRIYVSDSGRSRIFVFSEQGRFLHTIGALDRDESIFKRATGIAIDAKRGRLYVVDTIAMRIVVLTLDGEVIERFGQRGTGPGEFNYPTHIAVAPDGSVWVVDSLNFRVQHFDLNGRFLSAFGRPGTGPGYFDKAKGIAVDSQNRIYVVEGRNDRVQVYDPDGRLMFVFGSTGAAEGQFFLPTGVAVDANGRIFVADSYNRRVQMFQAHSDAQAALRKQH